MENVSFYCVNFKDEERRARMTSRFERLGLELNFVAGVEASDPRLDFDYVSDKRTASVMLQHIDSLSHFVENCTTDYCIVCEDDVMISKDLKDDLPEFIEMYEKFLPNVLLLGYLITFKLEDWYSYFDTQASTSKYKYRLYPDHLWGSQMYLVSRQNAINMIERYQPTFMLTTPEIPYNPDWTLTKNSNRLMVYPMVAVEEGSTKTDHSGQNEFHQQSHDVNFNPDIHF